MNEDFIIQILDLLGVIEDGHFKYRHGNRCGEIYLNKAKLFSKKKDSFNLANEIVSRLSSPISIDVIIGPEKGGYKLASFIFEVFKKTLHQREPPEVFIAKKTQAGDFTFGNSARSFFSKKENLRIFLIEDIINSGETVEKVGRAIRRDLGQQQIAALGAIWNRGGWHPGISFGAYTQFLPLVNREIPSYEIRTCPKCKAEIPFTNENLSLAV